MKVAFISFSRLERSGKINKLLKSEIDYRLIIKNIIKESYNLSDKIIYFLGAPAALATPC